MIRVNRAHPTLVAVLATCTLAACTGSSSNAASGSASPSAGPSSNVGVQTPSASSSRPTPASTKSTPRPQSTVPTAGGITRSPVAVTAKANFGGDVSARITSVTSVNGKANLPGEVAGPAVAVQITLTNSSTKKLALEAVVNLYSGPQLTPASSISGPPTKPFTDTLKAGSSARAVYTFTLATSQRSDVRVEFSYAPSAPVVLWDGPVG